MSPEEGAQLPRLWTRGHTAGRAAQWPDLVHMGTGTAPSAWLAPRGTLLCPRSSRRTARLHRHPGRFTATVLNVSSSWLWRAASLCRPSGVQQPVPARCGEQGRPVLLSCLPSRAVPCQVSPACLRAGCAAVAASCQVCCGLAPALRSCREQSLHGALAPRQAALLVCFTRALFLQRVARDWHCCWGNSGCCCCTASASLAGLEPGAIPL